ncbi:unnamed protein product [Linum trigynum]|uniref:TTF-type domain-containing protein n=1 Tax=Linum trigynum TaxID=586398 RepID=A0AAV2FXT9_9ROSI
MERYFAKKAKTTPVPNPVVPENNGASNIHPEPHESPSAATNQKVDLNSLQADPGLRLPITSFHPNVHDEIRRAYLQKGPCQPRLHQFPFRDIGGRKRRFNPSWYDKYSWIEYSVAKDAVYCLPCYLFRSEISNKGGSDAFVWEGFNSWNKNIGRLDTHVGGPNSPHNIASRNCEALMKQSQSIQVALYKQSNQAKKDYRICLEATVDCIIFLIRNGLALRGHDESDSSRNRGNFLELLDFHARGREAVQRVVLGNAPKNLQMTSPDIHKDIVHAIASQTTKKILKDIGDDFFAILVDESRDVSIKEQMAIVLRYVDGQGCVVERFLGVSHVSDTRAVTLKKEIESMLIRHGLSLTRIRGQGYDGASNMKGEINGLKTLILEENSSAYYVHCFAHQLQLTLVAVAKNHGDVSCFFTTVGNLLNLVGGSCKRKDTIRESHAVKVADSLARGEAESGRGLNQEIGLKRPGDTRWGSHYGTLVNLTLMFTAVIDGLEVIRNEGTSEAKGEAVAMLTLIQTFEFAFILRMMTKVLAITNELSLALQRKDQDIVNAMTLVRTAKSRLQDMRDKGWDPLLNEVLSFYNKECLPISDMNDTYVPLGRSRRNAQRITNLHNFQVELFYTVVDMQLQELNSRFDEVNTELLCCVACLTPDNSFSAFKKQMLLKLATFYPRDFSDVDISCLDDQLDTYIYDMMSNEDFRELKGIADLSKKMVKTNKHRSYPLVYMLVKLALILPVATSSVERAFSAMSYIKNKLRNRIGDAWMNDCLVGYIERDILDGLDKESILEYFQNMKTRRGSL